MTYEGRTHQIDATQARQGYMALDANKDHKVTLDEMRSGSSADEDVSITR